MTTILRVPDAALIASEFKVTVNVVGSVLFDGTITGSGLVNALTLARPLVLRVTVVPEGRLLPLRLEVSEQAKLHRSIPAIKNRVAQSGGSQRLWLVFLQKQQA